LFTDKTVLVNKTNDNQVTKEGGLASGPGIAQGRACLILDTLLNKVSTFESFEFVRVKTQRKLYSRVYWGMLLPGRYYFLTLTKTGIGESQYKGFKKFKWWLKRKRPGIAAAYCFTDEGLGVIHLVIRLGMKSKALDKEELDLYLCEKLGWGFSHIKRVKLSEQSLRSLADYLSDQNRKSRMSKEMAYQSRKKNTILRWQYIGKWLPPGWLSRFGRAWFKTNGMSVADRLLLFRSWLLSYHRSPADCKDPDHPVTWDIDVGWRDMEEDDYLVNRHMQLAAQRGPDEAPERPIREGDIVNRSEEVIP
jgi:hypothetical protein